jgi:probable biosynthetic protein (TIGR04098 family)
MKRTVQVGMPQMALGCVSENWLLKELGDLHWEALCASLGCASNALVDSQGRRLYATFVRVRIELDESLKAFPEGDEISFSGEMLRFGRSTVQSNIAIQGRRSAGTATLLTTFSVRERGDSNALMKSEPVGEYREMECAPDLSSFFMDYSRIRSEYGRCTGADEPPSDRVYRINPYIDSNGANLLYFASYQNMADALALRDHPDEVDVATKLRDICYFRNSELTDSVYLQTLDRIRSAADRTVGSKHLLLRTSDSQCLAYVETVKQA